jgi:hypothetical protein
VTSFVFDRHSSGLAVLIIETGGGGGVGAIFGCLRRVAVDGPGGSSTVATGTGGYY